MTSTVDDKDKHKSENTPSSSQTGHLISEKYFSDLEKWLNDAYMWQGLAVSFPYFLMCNQYVSQISSNNGNYSQRSFRTETPFVFPQNNGLSNQSNGAVSGNGIQCKVPALWKRLLAEFLDFLILFILKLAVTWIAIDFFEIIDLAEIDLNGLQFDMKKMDYKVAIKFTHNIMILEVIHRIVVCIYETFFLVGGVAGRIGGATPGKSMMGLRVVRCEMVTQILENETVIVYPGTDLGLGWAFARSFIKNLVLAIFIPFVVAFYYFRFNRAGYDMICNTIVIEEPIVPIRPHHH